MHYPPLSVGGCTLVIFLLFGHCQRADEADDDLPEEPVENTVDLVIADMTGPHEARPRGVPDNQGWATTPRVGMGNNPGNWRAMIAWGQLYEPVAGNPATNTRVQIRDLKAYYLSRSDNRWHLWQASRRVEGAAYVEDFAEDKNIPANLRTEPDGSVSVVPAGAGYNFHFWNPGRTPIDSNDIVGVFTTVQARLVVDDPDQPDDRVQARLILSVGADYWATMEAEWNYWTTNADIGIGKFKWVTTQWQPFNMHTMTPEELRENPPPLN